MTRFIKTKLQAARITFMPLCATLLLLLSCFVMMADAEATPKPLAFTQAELDTIGTTFAQAINNQDLDTLNEIFDLNAFARRAAKTVFDKDSDIRGFVKGFSAKGSMHIIRSIFDPAIDQKAHAKYLRTLFNAKEANPLIRLDMEEGGHEYILLTVEKNEHGNLVVVDLFLATSGKKSSVGVGTAVQLLFAPSQSMIKKLFGIKDVDKTLLTQLHEIGKLRREKKYAEAYHLIKGMPLNIRTQRIILDLAIQLSQAIDDKAYYQQLELLEKYHGNDPSAAFMLIDFHFSQGNMDKVIRSIDKAIARYGKDAALLNLKSSTAITFGKHEEALVYAKEAIHIEPDFEDAYWSLVSIYIATKQYTHVVSAFKSIEQNLGYEFMAENFSGDEFYADFVKSQPFSDWLK
jgi:tetratricopeptide (TPR) repeat protein